MGLVVDADACGLLDDVAIDSVVVQSVLNKDV
jgi:hypothetical protein